MSLSPVQKQVQLNELGLYLVDNIYNYLKKTQKNYQVFKRDYDIQSGSIKIDLEKNNQPYYQFVCYGSIYGTGEVGSIAIYCIDFYKLNSLLRQINQTNYLFGLKVTSAKLDSGVSLFIDVTFTTHYITHHNMNIYDADTYFFSFKVSFRNSCTTDYKEWIEHMKKVVAQNEQVANATFLDICTVVAKQTRKEIQEMNENENDIDGVGWLIGVWSEIFANGMNRPHLLGELYCKAFYIYFNVNIELF